MQRIQTKILPTLLFTAIHLFLTLPVVAAENRLELVHIHGLGFDQQGEELLVPAHFGMAIYTEGKWHKADGPDHDFMGFSITRDAFYSSGHPAQDSALANPFGLKKSNDNGKSWQNLGMQGEADFHIMSSGYNTNAIYLFNMVVNRTLTQRGLSYTLDDGEHWYHAEMKDTPEPVALATHPDNSAIVAAASREGLYLSSDHGQHFKQLDSQQEVYALGFDLDGQHLYYAGYDSAPSLTRLHINTGQRSIIELPALDRDAVAFIAQNPVRQQQLAIATFNRDVYLSYDGGKTWTPIALQGDTINSH